MVTVTRPRQWRCDGPSVTMTIAFLQASTVLLLTILSLDLGQEITFPGVSAGHSQHSALGQS
jgi:hypothetical protein